MLLEFYPVLQEPEFKNILITKSIYMLHKNIKIGISLNLNAIKIIAHQINADEFEKQVDSLCSRQQACLQFLLNLKDKKKSKKIVTKIKDEPTLRAHLTLIADSCCLVYTELSEEFFQHIKYLAENKKINKFIPLNDLIDLILNVIVMDVKMTLYRYEIPEIARKIKFTCCSPSRFTLLFKPATDLQDTNPKLSVLSQTDPFKILDVSFADSKHIIMQKVMKLIQQSPEQMAIFRQAQNELFNPAQRFLHHYFRYLRL